MAVRTAITCPEHASCVAVLVQDRAASPNLTTTQQGTGILLAKQPAWVSEWMAGSTAGDNGPLTSVEHHEVETPKLPRSADALVEATNRATASYDDRIAVLEELQSAIMEEQASLRVMAALAPAGLRGDHDVFKVVLTTRMDAAERSVERLVDLLEAWATSTRRSRRRWRKIQAARAAAEESKASE